MLEILTLKHMKMEIDTVPSALCIITPLKPKKKNTFIYTFILMWTPKLNFTQLLHIKGVYYIVIFYNDTVTNSNHN